MTTLKPITGTYQEMVTDLQKIQPDHTLVGSENQGHAEVQEQGVIKFFLPQERHFSL